MPRTANGLIREIFPHVYLLTASLDALERGEKTVEGSFYCFLTSILFAALTLEAYLNEVGEEKFADEWKVKEYGKSAKEKLNILCDLENYHPELGKRPFQSFSQIFKFRNDVVHAKPEKYEADKIELDERGIPKLPMSKWLEKCNHKNAVKYFDDTERMIIILHKELSVETISLLSPEHTTWWRSNVDLEHNAD